jgi:hypothetical protein
MLIFKVAGAMEKMLLPASVPCFADTAIYTYEVFKGESHEFT